MLRSFSATSRRTGFYRDFPFASNLLPFFAYTPEGPMGTAALMRWGPRIE
jgi:hypothetical protein